MAKMTKARRRMWRARVFFVALSKMPLALRAMRDWSEKMMETPTRKRKLGKTKSGRVKPFHLAWSVWAGVWTQTLGSVTRIMRAMVRPRSTSTERTRVGAAAVNEGWPIGAGAAGRAGTG